MHTLIDIPVVFLTFILWTGLCAENARKNPKKSINGGDKLYRIKQKTHL